MTKSGDVNMSAHRKPVGPTRSMDWRRRPAGPCTVATQPRGWILANNKGQRASGDRRSLAGEISLSSCSESTLSGSRSRPGRSHGGWDSPARRRRTGAAPGPRTGFRRAGCARHPTEGYTHHQDPGDAALARAAVSGRVRRGGLNARCPSTHWPCPRWFPSRRRRLERYYLYRKEGYQPPNTPGAWSASGNRLGAPCALPGSAYRR